jgi:alpha-tubulin suppressor-like RCC1 family protein
MKIKLMAVFALVITFALASCGANNSDSGEISTWEGGRFGFAGRVSAGQWGHFYVDEDGNLWGWGMFGRVYFDHYHGIPIIPLPIHTTPTLIMTDVAAVCAGGWGGWGMQVMVLRNDGSLWAFGSNGEGQLGDGNRGLWEAYGSEADRDEPVHIMDDVVAVSTGGGHTMAITRGGTLWGWGSNNFGQVGDGTQNNHTTPVQVKENVIAVSAGIGYTMAIDSDNVLWAWGANNHGALGCIPEQFAERTTRVGYARTAGAFTNYAHTQHLRIMENVAQVSASGHTMVIKTDGSLWAFGNNTWGNLGAGLPPNLPEQPWNHTPVTQATPLWIMDNVVAVSAGDRDSMALTADGTLYIWGMMSAWFQLPNTQDTHPDEFIPRQLLSNHLSAEHFPLAKDVVAMSASTGGTMLFLHDDGRIVNFGNNSSAQMGNGIIDDGSIDYETNQFSPTRSILVTVNIN